jgi:hypothetical protein
MRKQMMQGLLCLISVTFLFSGCAPKDVGEAKAKEIGLAHINQVFGANETEATVTKEQVECFSYQDGAIVSDGDASIAIRLIYRVRVAKNETQPLYETWVIGSSGKPFYSRQNELNIVLSDEQKQKAGALLAAESSWGEKHTAALNELKDACVKWVRQTLKEDAPVLLSAQTGEYPHTTITTTFIDSFYVVFRNGVIYQIAMQWPSMQVLSIVMVNEE